MAGAAAPAAAGGGGGGGGGGGDEDGEGGEGGGGQAAQPASITLVESPVKWLRVDPHFEWLAIVRCAPLRRRRALESEH